MIKPGSKTKSIHKKESKNKSNGMYIIKKPEVEKHKINWNEHGLGDNIQRVKQPWWYNCRPVLGRTEKEIHDFNSMHKCKEKLRKQKDFVQRNIVLIERRQNRRRLF